MKYLEIIMIFFELKFKEISKGIKFIIYEVIWEFIIWGPTKTIAVLLKDTFSDIYNFLEKHPAFLMGIISALITIVFNRSDFFNESTHLVISISKSITLFMVMTLINTLIIWLCIVFTKWISSNAKQTMEVYAERHK